MSVSVVSRGVLFADIRRAEDLESGDWQGGSSDPYVQVQVTGGGGGGELLCKGGSRWGRCQGGVYCKKSGG